MNKEIIKALSKTQTYEALINRFYELYDLKKPLPLLVDGLSDGALLSVLYSLSVDTFEHTKKPLLIVVPHEQRGLRLSEFLRAQGIKSEFYQVRDLNFYDITASHELEYERLRTLSALALGGIQVVVATPDACLQYTMPREELISRTLKITRETRIEPSTLASKLVNMGYTKCDLVESAGQFSIRGGIVDIFTTRGEYTINGHQIVDSVPVRIELFGDEIDRMAIFDTMSQRMSEEIDGFLITPSKEIIAGLDKKEDIKEEIRQLIALTNNEDTLRELKKELFSIENDLSSPFLDRFVSLVYDKKECLLNYFDDACPVVVCDSPAVSQKAKDAELVSNEIVKGLIEKGLVSASYAEYSAPVSQIDRFCVERQVINIDTFLLSRLDKQGGAYHFTTKGISFANHSLGAVIEELEYFTKNNYQSILVCQTYNEARACVSSLEESEIPAYLLDENAELDKIKRGSVAVCCDTYPEGFEVPALKLALVVLSSKKSERTRRTRRGGKRGSQSAGEKIMSYTDLNVGDYVVHVNYGVGRFLGIQNMCIMGAYRDYIAIQYAGNDKLYVPVDQLDMVAKYIGSRPLDGEVRLSKMDGGEWKRSTTKAKKAAKDMAKDLIELYARRTRVQGFACAPDGLMEHEFDTSFEYEETESQLQAITEIKMDMEKEYPMDRVLCGDVGYGKTEVAFRAAMKAIANNKQVAILVPTTILAMQHFQTALARFAGTGVNVGMISRFRSTKDQNATLRKLRRGDLDIIIGTHKLLNNKVEFKDLGLLIVDEEQRFGVAQKEKIKQLVPNVDVLTLSATPIPRTLNMAMSGIRDLSVLDEAPNGRVAIQSYVFEYDENIINDAISRELHRGGQVFYLYNNVEHIYDVMAKIRKAFPSAKIAVGHGQMDKEELEGIWQDLVQGDIDILISTTIIETGIDIPNANTLIIENADKMGLSQLHQIRGRVGRSHRRAYAYFTYRKGKVLSENQEKRLKAIGDFAEFGAGFKIAMRDLEIRGAGNILGAEQHGHLDSIGYDMYIRILNEAVLEEKGEVIEPRFETKMNMTCDAFLPKTYIESSAIRMEMYKKIAHIENEADYNDILSELTDRFGKLPRSAKNLLDTALIKAYAQRARIKKVDQLKTEVRLYPETIDVKALIELSSLDRKNIVIGGGKSVPYICVRYDTQAGFCSITLKAIKHYIKSSCKE